MRFLELRPGCARKDFVVELPSQEVVCERLEKVICGILRLCALDSAVDVFGKVERERVWKVVGQCVSIAMELAPRRLVPDDPCRDDLA